MHNTISSAEMLKLELQRLCEAIKAYADSLPSVMGTERLAKRAQRDYAFVDKTIVHAKDPAIDKNAVLPDDRSQVELQGVRNNLRGLHAELDVAWQAPAAVCLGARFYSKVSAGMTCSVCKHEINWKQHMCFPLVCSSGLDIAVLTPLLLLQEVPAQKEKANSRTLSLTTLFRQGQAWKWML